MGYKTRRPDGRRHHTRDLRLIKVPGSEHALVLGALDEASLLSHAQKCGLPLCGRKKTYGWWVLSNGHPRTWVRDSDSGEPGVYIGDV